MTGVPVSLMITQSVKIREISGKGF